MNEAMKRVVGEMTTRAHNLERAQVDEQNRAVSHRQHGDYTRAAIAEHTAQVCAEMVGIYRQAAGVLSGTWVPSPGQVTQAAEGLGWGVGVVRWEPPADASPLVLRQWRAFCDAVNQATIQQKFRTDGLIGVAHGTQVTGQDVPAPDPLMASPAEESGAHEVAKAGASRSASRWLCPECGGELRWMGEHYDEVGHVATGAKACPELVEPAAHAECGRGCGYPLILVDGTWLHAVSMAAECRPGAGAISEIADPVNVVHRDPAREVEGEPPPAWPAPPKRETARRGIGRVAGLRKRQPAATPERQAESADKGPIPYGQYLGRRVLVRRRGDEAASRGTLHEVSRDRLVLEPCEVGSASVLVKDVAEVFPIRKPRGAGRPAEVLEPRAYPDQPANGGPDPAQARVDEVAAQRREDLSELPLPPHGADAPTEAIRPVDGDDRG